MSALPLRMLRALRKSLSLMDAHLSLYQLYVTSVTTMVVALAPSLPGWSLPEKNFRDTHQQKYLFKIPGACFHICNSWCFASGQCDLGDLSVLVNKKDRPKNRWIDNVKNDMGFLLAVDRVSWRIKTSRRRRNPRCWEQKTINCVVSKLIYPPCNYYDKIIFGVSCIIDTCVY